MSRFAVVEENLKNCTATEGRCGFVYSGSRQTKRLLYHADYLSLKIQKWYSLMWYLGFQKKKKREKRLKKKPFKFGSLFIV